ncbi:MAG: PAS domain-containing protein [Usitatibacter sp.]
MMRRPKPTAFSLSLVLVCALVLALVAVLTWDIFSDREVDEANEHRAGSLALADELRQSSNILGRMATAYVLTGDPIFKRHYEDIVAILEGKMARPNAGRVHWDQFVVSDRAPTPAEGARSIALMDLLGERGLTAAEMAKLQDAKGHLNALKEREVAAMALVDSTFDRKLNQAAALGMLNDIGYRRDRAGLMAPIEDLRALVDERTLVAVKHAEHAALAMHIALIVICAFLVGILVRTYRVLLRVMGGSIDQVHARIAALGHGDFSVPIVVAETRRDSVMGWLADTQRKLAAMRAEREESTRRLRRSEEQFRQLADNIGEVFFLANRGCTEFFYVSPGFEELWGRTCESLYADPSAWHAAIHADDRARVDAALACEKVDGKFECECRIVRPDKTLRWIRVRTFPVRGDDGRVDRIAGFAVDTTHRTKLEVVARRDGKRFGRVVDNINVPCFIANAEGRITYCNEAALALTGWSRVELLGRASSEILAPFAIGPTIEASNDSGTWRMENRVMARDGSLRASTWRHIRLVSAEGIAEGTAMVAESVG